MLLLGPQVLLALTALGSGFLILVSVTLAYRLGRDQGMRLRSERFDRLFVEVGFHGTAWTICESTNWEPRRLIGQMKLHQAGSRLLAEGMLDSHNHWSAEGVVFRRGAHLLLVERRDHGHAVGTLNLHLHEHGLAMTGILSVWDASGSTGVIRSITFERDLKSEPHNSTSAVADSQHGQSTVVIQQREAHTSYGVDKLVNRVDEQMNWPLTNPFVPNNRYDQSR